ncbi:hypothetical protein [Nodosilinea sp. LEGE 07088]|nr:hypothetical protein [Nodosilinea sp. LEGE 07088]
MSPADLVSALKLERLSSPSRDRDRGFFALELRGGQIIQAD